MRSSARCWLTYSGGLAHRAAPRQRRQTGELAPKRTERRREDRTPQQTSCTQAAALPHPGSVQSARISHGWSSSLDSDSLLCLGLFFCNFYLGQRLLSCHVSPAVCTVYPGCHHRAWRRHTSGRSWTREEEEVIHKVCGPLKRKQADRGPHLQTLTLCSCSLLYQ